MKLFWQSPKKEKREGEKEKKKSIKESTETSPLIASKNLRKYKKMGSSAEMSVESFTNLVLQIGKAILDKIGEKPKYTKEFVRDFFIVAAAIAKNRDIVQTADDSADNKRIDQIILFIGVCYLLHDKLQMLIVSHLANTPIFKNENKMLLLALQWMEIQNYDSEKIADACSVFSKLAEILSFYFHAPNKKYFTKYEKEHSMRFVELIKNFEFQQITLKTNQDLSDIYKTLKIDEVDLTGLKGDQDDRQMERLGIG